MSGAPVWAYYDRYEQYYPGQDGSQASYGARQPPQNRGGPGGYMPAYGHMMPQAFTGYPIDPRYAPMPPSGPPAHYAQAYGRQGQAQHSQQGGKQQKHQKAAKNSGQAWDQVIRCAACLVDVTGIPPFIQHCQGKAHSKRSRGFAGIIPNAAGYMPYLSPEIIAACNGQGPLAPKSAKQAAAEAAKAEKGQPAVQQVTMSADAQHRIRNALAWSASEALGEEVAARAAAGGAGAGAGRQAAAGAFGRKGHAGSRGFDVDAPQFLPRGMQPRPPPTPPPPNTPVVGPGAQGFPKHASQDTYGAGSSAHQAGTAAAVTAALRGLAMPQRTAGGTGDFGGATQSLGTAGPRDGSGIMLFTNPGAAGFAEASATADTPGKPQREDWARGEGKDFGPREVPRGPPPTLAAPNTPGETPALADMRRKRAALPAGNMRDEIVVTITKSQVVIVEGETGSGKTTQVPQFILEEAAERGAHCHIICTQPRRLSAIGVAERVANERCERLGSTVGYRIRLEAVVSSATKLTFCTTGILLRRLESDKQLEGVTHVIIDEVHERSLESDFLLMVIRDLIRGGSRIRVVLMSATVNAALFSDYFAKNERGEKANFVPVVSIPGRTFPVTPLFLEDALEITGHRVRPNADWAKRAPKKSQSQQSSMGDFGSVGSGLFAAGSARRAGGSFVAADRDICFQFQQGRCTFGERCRFQHPVDARKPSGIFLAGATDEARSQMRTMAAQRCAHASAAAISPSIAPKDHKGSRSAPGQPFTGAFLSSGHHPLSNPSPASRPPALRALGGSPGSLAASNDDDDLLQEADLAERFPAYNPRVIAALGQLDSSQVNYELICQLVQWIMAKGTVEAVQQSVGGSTSYFPHQQQQSGGPPGAADAAFNDDDGAGPGQRGQQRNGPRGQPVRGGDGSLDSILIFLSGQKEIMTAYEMLTQNPPLCIEPQRSWVLPLHGNMTSEEQRRVFDRPPPGVRKIVLATNIAETSITIDDCGFVIDSGRMKETRYDPTRRMESLEDCFVSRSNARQRRGRAGRVKSGVAFHLVSRHRFERVLAPDQLPEIKRVPLEQLILRIKALKYGEAAKVCAKCIDPPEPQAVDRAIRELVRIDALVVTGGPGTGRELGEELTPLGQHLAALPVDVRIGKLILLGAIFGCVDDVLTIAATLSFRSPFLSPMDRRTEADEAKRSFCGGQSAQSDHLAALNAYSEFNFGGPGRFDMCREKFLGVKTLIAIGGLKRQLLELLSDAKFVRSGLRAKAVEAIGRRVDNGADGVRVALRDGVGEAGACFRCGQAGHSARECPLLTLEAGADGAADGLGSLLRFQPPPGMDAASAQQQLNGPLLKALLCAALYPQVMTIEVPKPKKGKDVKAENIKFRLREDGADEPVEVAIHPSSVNSRETRFASQYLVFHEKVKTTRIYVRDCSTVSPYALILFGGALAVERPLQVYHQRGRAPPQPADATLSVDGWIKFRVPRQTVDLLTGVRRELDRVMKRKIEQPDSDVSESGRHILEAVIHLISSH